MDETRTPTWFEYQRRRKTKTKRDVLEKQVDECVRLLNGLKHYSPHLHKEVLDWVHNDSNKTKNTHTFELRELDKSILGTLTIKKLGTRVNEISCAETLYEYTMAQPKAYNKVAIPGTTSAITNKIKFKVDLFKAQGKL